MNKFGSGGLQVNKFEQVSSLGHQMSLAGAGQEGFLYRGAAGTGVGGRSLYGEA